MKLDLGLVDDDFAIPPPSTDGIENTQARLRLDDIDPDVLLPSIENAQAHLEHADADVAVRSPSAEDVHAHLELVDTDSTTNLPSSEDAQTRGKLHPAVQSPLSQHDQPRRTTDTGVVHQNLEGTAGLNEEQRRLITNAMSLSVPFSVPVADMPSGIPSALPRLTPYPPFLVGPPKLDMPLGTLSALPGPGRNSPIYIDAPTREPSFPHPSSYTKAPTMGMPLNGPPVLSTPRSYSPVFINPPTLAESSSACPPSRMNASRLGSRQPSPTGPSAPDPVNNRSFITPPPKRVVTPHAPGRHFDLQFSPELNGVHAISTTAPPDLTKRSATGRNRMAHRKLPNATRHAPNTTLKDIQDILDKFSKQTQQTPATPAQARSPLLSLSGELRNRIYRFAILNPRTIEIDQVRWSNHQPALVRTCKQIRAEALRLFYVENKISANIHDWNPIVKDRCQRLMMSHGINALHLYHYFSGRPNWANLIDWLKAVFEGRSGGIATCVGKQRPLQRKTIGVMFLLVSKSRGSSGWPQLMEMLEAHRGLLGAGDARWLA